jgi:3-deoxy-D-manno-octulosonate 8-phosphate phosphatase (KDO 8-P phosphatase)
MDIKLVLTDIDGVWTDGGMYYGDDGHEWKKFNTSDSAGVKLLRLVGIQTGIITGENTSIVKRRAEKLNIDIVEMGVRRKYGSLKAISDRLKIPFESIAYIGDDVIDIPLLKAVGFSATPANAPDYVKTVSDVTLAKSGGQGVFREFAELILSKMNCFDQALELWLDEMK